MLGVLVVSHVQSWLIPSRTFAAYSYFWYIQRSSYFVLLIVIEVILFYVSLVASHSLFCILWVVGAHPIRGGGIWSVEGESPSWCAHNLLPNLPQPSICICNVKGWSRTLLIMFYWCHFTWACWLLLHGPLLLMHISNRCHKCHVITYASVGSFMQFGAQSVLL